MPLLLLLLLLLLLSSSPSSRCVLAMSTGLSGCLSGFIRGGPPQQRYEYCSPWRKQSVPSSCQLQPAAMSMTPISKGQSTKA